jgi:cytochrome c peroxidase
VKLMATYQLGKELKPEQVASIVTFLAALAGDLPADRIQPPAAPAK